MADILIRGMKTLKEPTPLTLYPDGRWNDYTDGANGEFLFLPEGHGKLGDLDALEDNIRSEPTFIAEMLFRKLRNALTIVPAEGDM